MQNPNKSVIFLKSNIYNINHGFRSPAFITVHRLAFFNKPRTVKEYASAVLLAALTDLHKSEPLNFQVLGLWIQTGRQWLLWWEIGGSYQTKTGKSASIYMALGGSPHYSMQLHNLKCRARHRSNLNRVRREGYCG